MSDTISKTTRSIYKKNVRMIIGESKNKRVNEIYFTLNNLVTIVVVIMYISHVNLMKKYTKKA